MLQLPSLPGFNPMDAQLSNVKAVFRSIHNAKFYKDLCKNQTNSKRRLPKMIQAAGPNISQSVQNFTLIKSLF